MKAEPAPTPPHRHLRRAGAILLTLLVAIAGAIALLLVFEHRDNSQVRPQSAGAATQGPGRLLPDQGDARLTPGQPRPRYLTDPPASGPHQSVGITSDADGTRLSVDQLLEALSLGDVVLLYNGPHPPAGLRALAKRIAGGPFSAALAASGQAIVLARHDGTKGITALAWRHELNAQSPSDPALAQFADYWIGRGAPS
jgi:uncharacterized protein DUF3105